MIETKIINQAFVALRKVMESYSPLTDQTWQSLKAICDVKAIDKNSHLYQIGEQPNSFSFVYCGLFRAFALDEKGNEYNKVFFDEGMFPGSMTALLTATPSQLTIESLEPSIVIIINFKAFRELLIATDDLKLFQIYYLEKNWLLAKDAREIQLIQEDATERYQRFLNSHGSLCARLPQYHIALHLGITPTQLSRIRKKL